MLVLFCWYSLPPPNQSGVVVFVVFYTASLNQFVGGVFGCVFVFTLLSQTSLVVVFLGCFFYTAPPDQSGGVFKKIFFYIAPPNQSGGGGFFLFCFLHCSPKPVWLVVVFLVCLFYTAPPNQSGGGVFVCVCCCFYTAPPNQLGGGGVLHWVNEVAVSIVSIHTCKLPQLQNAFMAHNIYNRILHCTLCFCKVDLIKNSEFQCRNTKNRTQTWKGSMTKKVVYIHCLCLFDSCHTWWAWRIVFIGQLSQ